MINLSDFPITAKWPAQNPNQIQLYSLPTPNGIKASAMLEESGLPYEAHLVSFGTDDQKTPEFLSLNPNGKIPAIIDPDGPGGKPFGLFESGAILVYLAEKSGRLLSDDPIIRNQTLQWLCFQMGGIGPMFGQYGHFKVMAGDKCDHPYPLERYQDETSRLLGVLDQHLSNDGWMAGGEYSIADMAIWPWVTTLSGFYQASDALDLPSYKNISSWMENCLKRPASAAAINIPPRD